MSLQLVLLNQLLRWQIKRRFRRNPDVNLLRPLMQQMEARTARLPADIAAEDLSLGGVAAERLSAPGADQTRTFLYIHGGGFVGGSPRT
ncbi:MAG: hypothetical protein LPK88_12935, partial [Alphaproteobacteria bacterium]|nr:hypothetical protein [Alphaproteobacteria bacterium]MDX5417204.1 hypothetical protein [Alphaproteobacteria bacterium]MDX5494643.1 hypothetical protein [Alphaproteobacteria bacterium]